MHCKRSNNEGTYHLKENGVLVTDKKKVAEIFNNYFSLIQNVGEGHDSDPNVQVNVAVGISVHPSIAAIRDECVLAECEFNHVSTAETDLILSSQIPIKLLVTIRFLIVSYGMEPQFWLILLRDRLTPIDNACVPAIETSGDLSYLQER